MAKKKLGDKTDKSFKLSDKATTKLNNYLAEIRKGVMSVCELHTHDTNPSLNKVDFEVAFIDKVLGQTANAVSVSIHAMVEGLQAQKKKELQTIIINNKKQPTTGKEDAE